jgi:hypothetical protein
MGRYDVARAEHIDALEEAWKHSMHPAGESDISPAIKNSPIKTASVAPPLDPCPVETADEEDNPSTI